MTDDPTKGYLEGAIDDGFLDPGEGEEARPRGRSTNTRAFTLADLSKVRPRRRLGRGGKDGEKRRISAVCISRSGVERDAHQLDKDHRCIFCDARARGLG